MARSRTPRVLQNVSVDQMVNQMQNAPLPTQQQEVPTPMTDTTSVLTWSPDEISKATISWSDGKGYSVTRPITDFPFKTVATLAQQATNHRLGNMADATVNTSIRKDKLNLPASNPKEYTEAQKKAARDSITTWRKNHADELVEMLRAARDEQWAKMLAGEIEPGGGPRLDPVEREYRALLLKQARKDLEGKTRDDFPSKDDDTVTLNNGRVLSRRQMLEITEQRYGDDFRARAEQIVAAREATVASESADANADF